jgi:antitoxin (DNA-binding transcriptional repressor) of toxin-antitoxin stability system
MLAIMKTMTVRDLRQRWPEAERALQDEDEIIITRDGQPVAKLVRILSPKSRKQRFDAVRHARWQKKVNRGKVVRWVSKYLERDRNDPS